MDITSQFPPHEEPPGAQGTCVTVRLVLWTFAKVSVQDTLAEADKLLPERPSTDPMP